MRCGSSESDSYESADGTLRASCNDDFDAVSEVDQQRERWRSERNVQVLPLTCDGKELTSSLVSVSQV